MIKYKELKSEKEVENFWWDFMKYSFPNCTLQAREISKNTDGILIDDVNNIRTLIEVKEELDLKKPSEQAKVLIQSIFYIKQHELGGHKLPKTVFIADKNEAFIIHTNSLLKYLDYDIDWRIAPSQAYKFFPDMIIDIAEDEKINPFVFSLKEGFNFDAIKLKLIDLNQNVKRLIKITDKNLQQVFEYFIENILIKNKLSINEQVNLFVDLLINPHDNFLHPKKKNTIHTESLGYIKVNEKNFISFFDHYDGEQYTVREKEKMVSIIDRLIEDETRKRNGEFFTPTIWVDEAHKMISEQFGLDWKEKYIVWDCAWGTGNLTRDYKFKELYCSTLHESDINTAEQMNINPEAIKFQFDFLNDDFELLKEPDYAPGLWKSLQEGKEIIFLINPPYATSNNLSKVLGDSKEGVADTKIGLNMKKEDWGAATRQLYAQFLFRISKIKNSNVAIFAKSLYKSGKTYKLFREKFYEKFTYKNGMLFCASHFDSVSNAWGVDFSIWIHGYENRNTLPISLKDVVDYNVRILEEKNIYNLDNVESSAEWVRKDIKGLKLIDTIQLSSALNAKQANVNRIVPNSLSYLRINTNNVMSNNQAVGLYSSATSGRGGVSILKENFDKTVAIFVARKTITNNYANWINDKDEYLAPTDVVLSSPVYKQWNNDAIVYSLFNTSSNQSSMRQVEYKDKLWDIKNEFFWLSKHEMMELAEEHYFDELYKDARSTDERYVYNLLQETNLSPDAQELLDMSKELIKKSFKMRKIMSEEYPEYHLNTWDAGWYQIKKVLNIYYKEDYKIFVKKYKAFEDRMRPYVYKFGFLKQ